VFFPRWGLPVERAMVPYARPAHNRCPHYTNADFVMVRVRQPRRSGAALARSCAEQHDVHGGEELVERRLLQSADPARERRRRHVELARKRVHAAHHLTRPVERAGVDRYPRLGKRRAVNRQDDRIRHVWKARERAALSLLRERL